MHSIHSHTLRTASAYFSSLITAIALSLSLATMTAAAKPIPVVATFSILGDMVERIGGAHVTVAVLVGRNGDSHVYRPTPQDAKAVKEARILFINGLAFEGWLARLSEAASFNGIMAVATQGITPICFKGRSVLCKENADDYAQHGHDDHKSHHDGDDHKVVDAHHESHQHGAVDPHAWMSPLVAITYVNNIADALIQALPAQASVFSANRDHYIAQLKALHAEINTMITALPNHKRSVVTSHDAFQYFSRDYGLHFYAPQGLSTESEASAQEVANLIQQMRVNTISAIFIENITDARLIKQIASETNATIGGKLYTALSEKEGPAATYLDLLRHNANTLVGALKK